MSSSSANLSLHAPANVMSRAALVALCFAGALAVVAGVDVNCPERPGYYKDSGWDRSQCDTMVCIHYNGCIYALPCYASTNPDKDGSDGAFYCINGGSVGGNTGYCTCMFCNTGYSGSNCQTADACTASANPDKDGTDGAFYCINGGTIGGTIGDCTCTSCNTGYSGVNCQTADACTASTDPLKDGLDGAFHCIGGTIGGTTGDCTCTCDDDHVGVNCVPKVEGCTDSAAYNYNPLANVDDNSCVEVGHIVYSREEDLCEKIGKQPATSAECQNYKPNVAQYTEESRYSTSGRSYLAKGCLDMWWWRWAGVEGRVNYNDGIDGIYSDNCLSSGNGGDCVCVVRSPVCVNTYGAERIAQISDGKGGNSTRCGCAGVLCNNGQLCTVTGGAGVCSCPDGYSGSNCQTADACTASANPDKDGSDGAFHCVHGGTIGGTTGDCTCTCPLFSTGDNCEDCVIGYNGTNCLPQPCTTSANPGKNGTDGEFYCVHGGTIGGTTGNCECTDCDYLYGGASCEECVDGYQFNADRSACVLTVVGCMDDTKFNYNPDANADPDDSCVDKAPTLYKVETSTCAAPWHVMHNSEKSKCGGVTGYQGDYDDSGNIYRHYGCVQIGKFKFWNGEGRFGVACNYGALDGCICIFRGGDMPVCANTNGAERIAQISDEKGGNSTGCGCNSTLCNNGQFCTVTDGAGVCSCPPHHTGDNCESCITGYGGDDCTSCAPGYEGNDCDNCDDGYFDSNGVCVFIVGGCTNPYMKNYNESATVDDGLCVCENGKAGDDCSIAIPQCSCDNGVGAYDGTCLPGSLTLGYFSGDDRTANRVIETFVSTKTDAERALDCANACRDYNDENVVGFTVALGEVAYYNKFSGYCRCTYVSTTEDEKFTRRGNYWSVDFEDYFKDPKCSSCNIGFTGTKCDTCAIGYNGTNCLPEPCTKSTDALKDGTDGAFYCVHGTIGGTTGNCECDCGATGFTGDNCDECVEGKGHNVTTGKCEVCPEDWVNNVLSTSSVNNQVSHDARCALLSCDPGFGQTSDVSVAWDPTNTSDTTGNCVACAGNTVSPGGQGQCVACDPGYHPNAARSACVRTVVGCRDVSKFNYNPDANADPEGSCVDYAPVLYKVDESGCAAPWRFLDQSECRNIPGTNFHASGANYYYPPGCIRYAGNARWNSYDFTRFGEEVPSCTLGWTDVSGCFCTLDVAPVCVNTNGTERNMEISDGKGGVSTGCGCGADAACNTGQLCTVTGGAGVCSCPDGYSGSNCQTAHACTASANPDKDGMDGAFHCVHGTIGGTTGDCTCTCAAGYSGKNCQTADACTKSENPLKDGSDGAFHCIGGTIGGTTANCTCTCDDDHVGVNCVPKVEGCTDSAAYNYNPLANADPDDSCVDKAPVLYKVDESGCAAPWRFLDQSECRNIPGIDYYGASTHAGYQTVHKGCIAYMSSSRWFVYGSDSDSSCAADYPHHGCYCTVDVAPVCVNTNGAEIIAEISDGKGGVSTGCGCGSTQCNTGQLCTVTGGAGVCSCPDGYSGKNCQTADACTASANPDKDGSDGAFHCVHGTIGGTTGDCTCTCAAGYSGKNCQTADACTASTDPLKDGSDGAFYCVHGTIGNTTGSCTCDCGDTGFTGDSCHECVEGKGFNNVTMKCEVCPEDYVNNQVSHDARCALLSCEEGHGQTSDESVEWDPVNASDTSGNCVACAGNTVSPGGQGQCVACDPGYQPNAARSACVRTVVGCRDDSKFNYNPDANADPEGSCVDYAPTRYKVDESGCAAPWRHTTESECMGLTGSLPSSRNSNYRPGCSYVSHGQQKVPHWNTKNDDENANYDCTRSFAAGCYCTFDAPVCANTDGAERIAQISDGKGGNSTGCGCADAQCNTGQFCTVTDGAGVCSCPPHHTGDNCESCITGYGGDNCEPEPCTASANPDKDGTDGEFHCVHGGTIGGTTGDCTCTCAAGYSGKNCQTADACTASANPDKDGSDGAFYCVHGGTIGGTTGNCECTNCDDSYGGASCEDCITGYVLIGDDCHPDVCTASTDPLKDGSDGVFYCINGGTIGGTLGDCTCTSCNTGYGGDSCEACGYDYKFISDNECKFCPQLRNWDRAQCFQDCAGVSGGDAVRDKCGTCDNDPSNDCVEDLCDEWGGNNSCLDCAGVPNGDAVLDKCNTCDNDPDNNCEQDCKGDWGGDAVEDECDTCDSDPDNNCVQDACGNWGGDHSTCSCDQLSVAYDEAFCCPEVEDATCNAILHVHQDKGCCAGI